MQMSICKFILALGYKCFKVLCRILLENVQVVQVATTEGFRISLETESKKYCIMRCACIWHHTFQCFGPGWTFSNFFFGGGVLHHKTNGKWHIKHYWVMHTMGGLHYMSLSIHQQIVKLWQDFLFSVAIHPLNMEIVHDITVPLPESVWKHLLTRWVH